MPFDRKCHYCAPESVIEARSAAHALELIGIAKMVMVHCHLTGPSGAWRDDALFRVEKREAIDALKCLPDNAGRPLLRFHVHNGWAFIGG